MLTERPARLPTKRPDGSDLKPIPQILAERRATSSFASDPVPDDVLRAIIHAGLEAPSGYNLQPWRFIVIRKPENKQRLRKVAFDQTKITEAPVVLIAVGMTRQWRDFADEIFAEGPKRGFGKPQNVEAYKQQAMQFLDNISMPVWVNRHTMIALTTMMLTAEAYGFNTAPMEGFDADGVKREFGIPDDGEAVALLAIGKAKPPIKPFGGRLLAKQIVFGERFGAEWQAGG